MTTTLTGFTMTIDGKAVSSPDTIGVHNPTTGEIFAEVPNCTREQLDEAMQSAQRAFDSEWSTNLELRRKVMYDAAQAVEAAAEEIGRMQTLEQGTPLPISINHARAAASGLRHYADIDIPRMVIQDNEDALIEVVRRPLGVIAAIKPWNVPIFGVVGSIGAAFRVGCTVVYKPSPYTPVSALVVAEVLRDVIPAGALNIITGADPLGQWMTEHPIPRGISFTGSTATGKKVNQSAAADLKRVCLELGGNDAVIALDDIDPQEFAEKLFWTAFRNSGQICMAAKRVYVPESKYEAVANALAEIAKNTKVGDPLDESTELGPLCNEMQFERVKELVADALANGATAVTGGHPMDRPGYFFEPTILTGIKEGVRIVDEEQFGPALPILSYKTVDEAVARANATTYGLGGSVWSADQSKAKVIAEQLQSGNTWINTHSQQNPNAPFGGVKWSGLGSQNGLWSVYALTDPQTVWTSRRGPTTYSA